MTETNKAADPENMTEAEKKHTPVISMENGKIKVIVGKITHPMVEEHHITYIELFNGDESVGMKELNAGDAPEAEFEGVVSDNLKAQAVCNVHGLWESL